MKGASFIATFTVVVYFAASSVGIPEVTEAPDIDNRLNPLHLIGAKDNTRNADYSDNQVTEHKLNNLTQLLSEGYNASVLNHPHLFQPTTSTAPPQVPELYSEDGFIKMNFTIGINVSSGANNTLHDDAMENIQSWLNILIWNIDSIHNESLKHIVKSQELDDRLSKKISDIERANEQTHMNVANISRVLDHVMEEFHQLEIKQDKNRRTSEQTQEYLTSIKSLSSANNEETSITNLTETFNVFISRVAKLQQRITDLEKSDKKYAPEITRDTCNGHRRHLVGDSCYYVPEVQNTERAFSWWDGRFLCKRPDVLGPNADLAAIETQQEMKAITKLLNNHFGGIEEFWLGGSDLEQEDQWRWVSTGEHVTYNNWAEPPEWSPNLNCMTLMMPGALWTYEPCFYERYPLCELKLSSDAEYGH